MNKKSALIAAALVIVVALSLGFFWPFSRSNKSLKIPGTVEVFEIRLGSKVGGRVAEVHVREGQEVDAKHKLVRFEAPELDAQRSEADQRPEDGHEAGDGELPEE